METAIEPVSDMARRFAEEYLIDFKAGPAALRAGYADVTAGYNLLQDPRVDALIRDGKMRASGRVQISQDMVLENFRVMTSVTAADFFYEAPVMVHIDPADKESPLIPSGKTYMALKSLDDWTEPMRYALKSIKHGQYGPEIVLHDKAKTNEMLGKYLGMFVDRVQHDVGGEALKLITAGMDAKTASEAYEATMRGNG